MYKEFLEMCAYSPQEIDKELPRVKKAFDRAGLTEEDMKRGRERLIEYFDAENLRGVRMIAGLCIKEFVDLVLSGEEHDIRLYAHMPTVGAVLLTAAKTARPDIYVGYPLPLSFYVLGTILNRIEPYLEAAESFCLPPGVAHCGCNQFKLGSRITGLVPPASLHLSAGMYCDEAPKADEVFQFYFGDEVFWFNRCQDEDFDDPMDERHLKYLSHNVDRARQKISEIIGVDVTKDLVLQEILTNEGIVKAFSRIGDIRAEADPAPIPVNCCGLLQFSMLSVLNPFRRGECQEAMKVLGDEAQARVDRGEGVVPKGAPRVMLSVVLPLSTPGIPKAMEDAGLNVCCQEGKYDVGQWERRLQVPTTDACDIIAGIYLLTPLMMKATMRVEVMVNDCREGNLDGIIMLPHFSCRVFGNDYMMIKDGVKRELGDIPILILETDLFDPRYYTAEQSRTRIESFAEMVKTAVAAV